MEKEEHFQGRRTWMPHTSATANCSYGLYSGWTLCPAENQGQPTPVFLPGESHGQKSLVVYSPRGRKESDTTEWLNYFYKRHWCRQTSLPYITHAYKTRGSVPSRTPHTCTSHHTHAFWTQSLSHPRSIMKLKTSGSEAGDSGVGWRMERKYLDGICETNWDREINTPIWLEKQKSLN